MIRIRKGLHLYFLLLIGCFGPPSDKTRLNVFRYNTEPKSYQSVLIAYSGTSVDRVMLENTANELMRKLTKLNVVVHSRFFSEEGSSSLKSVVQVAKEMAAESILVITPMKTARMAEYYSYHPGFENRQAKAAQIASLELYDWASFEKPVWGARFNIYVTIDNRRSYRRMASKIMYSLQTNAIWQNKKVVK